MRSRRWRWPRQFDISQSVFSMGVPVKPMNDAFDRTSRRLALNIGDVARLLRVSLDELWKCVDEATAAGAGTKTLNLSPHGAILSSLLQQRGPNVFQELANAKRGQVFVPLEIELPFFQKESLIGLSDRDFPVDDAISTSELHLDTARGNVRR